MPLETQTAVRCGHTDTASDTTQTEDVMPVLECSKSESEQRAEALRLEAVDALLDAGRMFVADHEASGCYCAGLTAAYLAMRAAITKAEGGLR